MHLQKLLLPMFQRKLIDLNISYFMIVNLQQYNTQLIQIDTPFYSNQHV